MDLRSEKASVGHFLQPKWGDGPWGGGTLDDRFDAVRPLILGESVLDVGCASRYGKPDWIHGRLAQAVPHLTGIDLNAGAIETLQAAGFNVETADAQDFDLHQKFDTVFAGELIEHLDDVRGFLLSARRHLRPNGRLVLTTPNAFYVANFIYRWGGHGQVHPEHKCWYCVDTLTQVLQANGYGNVEVSFIGHTSPTRARKIATSISRHVLPPQLALDTLAAVARLS